MQKPTKPEEQAKQRVEQENQDQAAQQLAQIYMYKEQEQEQAQGLQQSQKVQHRKQNKNTSQTAPHPIKTAQKDAEGTNQKRIVERQTGAISVQTASQQVQKPHMRQHQQHQQHQQHHSQQHVSQVQQTHHPTQVVPIQTIQYVPNNKMILKSIFI